MTMAISPFPPSAASSALPDIQQGHLVLADGSIWSGRSFGAPIDATGEVVFCTGPVGYPESLTDPSYQGQILVFTYPLIGNYGVPMESASDSLPTYFESNRIQVRGVIVATHCTEPHHWTAQRTLGEWLQAEGIPALEGIDTRMLTQTLRAEGVMAGRIAMGKTPPIVDTAQLQAETAAALDCVVQKVSVPAPIWRQAPSDGLVPRLGITVGVLDCGAKNNIFRCLLARGADVVQLPWDVDLATLDTSIDGLLISNGPGDPKDAQGAVRTIQTALRRRLPTFGICFGNQLLALAVGADTYKLKFGHRGQNQPCIDLTTGRCYVTSQNHGYAVDERTLPFGWEPWFRNANDGTNEGIRHNSAPFRSVQFHPEAYPGPEDVAFLIDDFLNELIATR